MQVIFKALFYEKSKVDDKTKTDFLPIFIQPNNEPDIILISDKDENKDNGNSKIYKTTATDMIRVVPSKADKQLDPMEKELEMFLAVADQSSEHYTVFNKLLEFMTIRKECVQKSCNLSFNFIVFRTLLTICLRKSTRTKTSKQHQHKPARQNLILNI